MGSTTKRPAPGERVMADYGRRLKAVLDQLDEDRRNLKAAVVYNAMPAVPVDPTTEPTPETCRQADALFDTLVSRADGFKRSKVDEKRRWFRLVLHAAKRAGYVGGSVRYPRGYHDPNCSKARLQVIDCAVEAGIFHDVRSPRGSPKMSRLVLLSPAERYTTDDPRDIDPETLTRFVFMQERHTGRELPIEDELRNPRHVAARTQRALERVNRVNGRVRITFYRYDPLNDEYGKRMRLRPVHFARFTDRWDWHGRLYTARYGHQSLRKVERATIRFDGERSVERDFSGMHCRMLYHLGGIPYRRDPYCLWGDDTTPERRLMAKKVINAAINAATPQGAVAACNHQMNPMTRDGEWKTGKDRHDANEMRRAVERAGLSFREVYALAVSRHRRIADQFGKDKGIELMRTDGAIALDILSQFAGRGVPCLGCHDSFIVPVSYETELVRVMKQVYRRHTGHDPEVR